MKRLALPSCFLWPVLLSVSIAASILLFDIGVACRDIFVSTFVLAARSNRAIAYVVFNFISLVIFLGFLRSSKQMSGPDIEGMFFVPPSPQHIHDETMLIQQGSKEVGDSEDDEDDEYRGYDGSEEDNDDDMEAEEDEDSTAEEGDSDLERRSEEFIEKMNSKWREELLHERFLCMVYASAPKLELL
ncbi:Proteasome subunit beta [Psidium guajava]|nr:Proteasome subunit beta [Psidium guajava]